MSTLYRHLRVHQVFGANTDVGKTLLTAALVRASAALGNSVYYLKPVSTGPIQDADDEHVKRFAGQHKNLVDAACLFRYDDPVSPHLAATMQATRRGIESASYPTDPAFVSSVASHIRSRATQVHSLDSNAAHMYVETAGGVHSPVLSGSSQLDAYRPLRLPTVLVADARLGGISATIAAYESLLVRGYELDQVLIFKDDYYRNYEYLQPYFAERGVRLDALPAPPERHSDDAENFRITDAFYASLAPENREGAMFDVVKHLDVCHEKRLDELASMPRRTLESVWWPFVQHRLYGKETDVNVIDSAWGDYFSVYNGHRFSSSSSASPASAPAPSTSHSLLNPQFDGSASWWTQALGHAHPSLALAAARAAGRYGHVMFPLATHAPALKLSERLLQGPGRDWAARVFLSDDGSTGMEVAIKMAIRTYLARNPDIKAAVEEEEKSGSGKGKKGLGVLGLEGSYHGDTIGAMDACAPGVYTCEWHDARGFWLEPPTVAIRHGRTVVSLPPSLGGGIHDPGPLARAYDVRGRLNSDLAKAYEKHITQALEGLKEKGERLAALVLEPIVLGAGGMLFVDPLFQHVLVATARRLLNLPVVFDEVFTGLYRLGLSSPSSLLQTTPDISVHAKILTGGLVPLAATLATKEVFEAFWGEKKEDALLHGHSYSAHAVGCEVALETLGILDKMEKNGAWDEAKTAWGVPTAATSAESASTPASTVASNSDGAPIWSLWSPSLVDALSKLPGVCETMAMGTVLAITLEDTQAGYASHTAAALLSPLTFPDPHADVGELSAAPGGAPFGVHHRTLGNVAYFMTSLNTPPESVRAVEDRLWEVLNAGLRGSAFKWT
ncbi:onanonoxo-7-onima-8-eninoihtemlysoneda [Peniophora sp. CONT]|nr:onanonoxo-7-onima-8-eninoihtemlysoneda [Peniophora sp. CONT]